MTNAVAAAVYFDHELASSPEPLVAMIEALTASGGPYRQWYIDAQNSKASPPTPFNRDKLIGRIRKGETSVVGVESEPSTADKETLVVKLGTTPRAKKPERYTLTHCRYEAFVALGAMRTAGIGSVIEFADAVAVRAGAVFVADTAAYAMALATGGGGLSLTAAEVERITDGLIGRSRWGDIIRGPAWGTFLGASHVEKLGGMTHVERESGCARVIALSSGGAYLQTTAEPTDAVRESLVRFLEPVQR